jgi:hypothetical protein
VAALLVLAGLVVVAAAAAGAVEGGGGSRSGAAETVLQRVEIEPRDTPEPGRGVWAHGRGWS